MTEPSAHEPADPVATAAGNASALGLGYLLLGRRGLAAGTAAVTIALLGVLVVSGSVVVEALLVAWWLATIVHGWLVARRRGTGVDGRARRIAFPVAVLVLLGVAVLRVDAARVAGDVDAARSRGDCDRTREAQGRMWPGPRLADAPAAARGDGTVEVCAQLDAARAGLDRTLGGDLGTLGSAEERMARVLRQYPGHERMVEVTVDEFVERMRGTGTCAAVTAATAIRDGAPVHPGLMRLADGAAAAMPSMLVGCGDERSRVADWAGAATRYRQALALAPAGPLTARARQRLADAEAGRSRSDLRSRLDDYCSAPFPYLPAPAPGPGARTFVDATGYDPTANPFTEKVVPDRVRTADMASAAVAVCVERRERGSVARTCTYENVLGRRTFEVSFHRVAVPVRVYEVRTARALLDRRIEIDGPSCPPTIQYLTSVTGSGAPDSDQDVTVADAAVTAAVAAAVDPFLPR